MYVSLTISISTTRLLTLRSKDIMVGDEAAHEKVMLSPTNFLVT
jgi:hypothetical protein